MTQPLSEQIEALADAPCECGDYRSDHPNDGPCRHNSRVFDLCHAGQDCMKYRPMTIAALREKEDRNDG